ncbi:MAG: DMT family transporter [Erysipelotrichaceae bacterium]
MYIVIAFVLGIINVISKSVNYKATEKLGSLSGSFMNYFEAAVISLIIILFNQKQVVSFSAIPWYLYLGGLFGAIAFFFNITSLSRMNLFMSTMLVLIGQLIGSVIIDFMMGISVTPLKIAGIIVMFIGIYLDKKMTIPA